MRKLDSERSLFSLHACALRLAVVRDGARHHRPCVGTFGDDHPPEPNSDHQEIVSVLGPISARPSCRQDRQFAIRHHIFAHPNGAPDAYHLADLGEFLCFNAQFLAWSYRLEEFKAIDGREQCNAGVAVGSRLRRGRSKHHSSGLGHCFDQKHARQNGSGRKVPGENRARRIDQLQRNTTDTRLQFFHPIDP
jgi:hypothetical protein